MAKNRYITSIKQRVAAKWRPPRNVPGEVKCIVGVIQIRSGEVINVVASLGADCNC